MMSNDEIENILQDIIDKVSDGDKVERDSRALYEILQEIDVIAAQALAIIRCE